MLYRREGKADSACTMQEKAAKDAEKAGRFEDAMQLYLGELFVCFAFFVALSD